MTDMCLVGDFNKKKYSRVNSRSANTLTHSMSALLYPGNNFHIVYTWAVLKFINSTSRPNKEHMKQIMRHGKE